MVGVLPMRMAVVHVIQVVAMLLAGVPAARAVHVRMLGVRRVLVHAPPRALSVPVRRAGHRRRGDFKEGCACLEQALALPNDDTPAARLDEAVSRALAATRGAES